MGQDEIIWRPEEIVAMCKDAGFADGVASIVGLWGLHEFAKLVDAKATAKEREACAKLVEVSDELEDWEIICGNDGRELLNAMANAIRERGEQHEQ